MTGSPRLPLAICGTGRFAARRVWPAIQQSEKVRLTAVVCRPGRTLEWVAPEVSRYGSLDQFLQTGPAGAVYVATPNALHAPHTIACLNAGLHVLCEKPMATRSRDARAMMDAARSAGRHLQVGHMLRYSPALQLARQWLEAGRIGTPHAARAQFHYELSDADRPWARDPALAGGGVLLDAGVHCVDVLRWLFDGPTAIVDATIDSADPAMLEKVALCRVRLGQVDCLVDVRSGCPYLTELVVEGTRGRMVVANFAACWGDVVVRVVDNTGAEEHQAVDVSMTYRDQIDGFAHEAAGFPYAFPATAAAAETVALVEGLYAASRELS